MGFFLPSFWQKRILRFALSHIDLLDIDALDLDNLDIAIGKRSTVELKSVGIRLDKLSSLLNLPAHVKVSKALIALIRLHVPADIYNSGIYLEIVGVRVEAATRPDRRGEKEGPTHREAYRDDSGRERTATDPSGGLKGRPPSKHEKGKHASKSYEDDGKQGLPTATDLAQSFLQTEPEADKEELKATISNSHRMIQSQHSESVEDDADEGLGDGFSMPGFVAGFLSGVVSRIQAVVKDVCLDMAITVDTSSLGPHSSSQATPDTVIFRLSVAEIAIGPVTVGLSEEKARQEERFGGSPNVTLGNRRVSLKDIQGALLSDTSIFSWLAQYSVPSSPSVTQSSASKKQYRSKTSPPTSDQASSSSETGLGLVQSSFIASVPSLSRPRMSFSKRSGQDSYLQAAPATQGSLTDSIESLGNETQSDREEQSVDWGDSSSVPFASAYDGHEQESQEHQRSSPHPGAVSFERQQDATESLSKRESQVQKPASQHDAVGETYLGTLQPQYSTDNLRFGFESQKYPPDYTPGSEQIASPDPDIFEYRSPDSSPDSTTDRSQALNSTDLTQSRLFSHEEAASMYQSAVSLSNTAQSSLGHIPGQWTDEDPQSFHDEARSATPTAKSPTVAQDISTSRTLTGGLENTSTRSHSDDDQNMSPHNSKSDVDITEDPLLGSQGENGLSSSKQGLHDSSPAVPLMMKRFFSINTLTLDIPEKQQTATSESEALYDPQSTQSEENLQDLPGGFSRSTINSPSISSREYSQQRSTRLPQTNSPPMTKTGSAAEAILVSIQNITFSSDMGLIRLAVVSSSSFVQPGRRVDEKGPDKPRGTTPNLSIRVESMRWNFLSSIKGSFPQSSDDPTLSEDELNTQSSDILLALRLDACSFLQRQRSNSSQRDICIGRFTFGYEDEAMIEFDSSLRMRDSIRDVLAPVGQDIKITISESLKGPSEITVMTVPIHVNLDLTRLDETFSWFGGLSGMLELGNSMISTVTITDPKPRHAVPPKTGRAVRFETPTQQTLSSVETRHNKITARIGGVLVDIHGRDASVALEGSAVKVVSRAEGIGVRIDKLKFAGPLPSEPAQEAAITAMLEVVKVEYLQFPTEDDLGRLLALLSPSRERDDSDDDILLDTFLRQRRQGGVLRVSVDKVESSTGSQNEFNRLLTMSEELKKLSTVAKYLPEDDRPGILTLGRITHFALTAKINKTFGPVSVVSTGLEVGHVSFPSLFLLGIQTADARHDSHALIGPLLDHSNLSKSATAAETRYQPTVTARLIGDELEPTLKIRLWNLRLDYHVSTLMAFLGISETALGEVIVNDLVQSIGTLASQPNASKLPREPSGLSDDSQSSKTLKFDIAMRDTALSLNPRASPAQALLILTHAKIAGNFPKGAQSDIRGSFEIKKMSVLIVDDTSNIQQDALAANQSQLSLADGQIDHLEALKFMGYVSVSEISSASIAISVAMPPEDAQKCVDVEIRDDLFVLETCADSTQTLQTILSGLSPPTPPSKELRYRTEVVPVQDMLASLTGDAYATDPAHEDDTDYRSQLSEDEFLDDEESSSMDFAGSFYDPNMDDDPEMSSAQSSLALSQETTSVNQHTDLSVVNSKLVDEPEEGAGSIVFDENYFSGTSKSKAETQRWNSNRNAYEAEVPADPSPTQIPFRLRVRDVHIIWNMFDGYDWQRTRDTISHAVAEVESKAAEKQARRDKRKPLEEEEDEDSVIGDFLFNSIYIGVGVNQNPRDLARQVNRNLDDVASEAESYATTTTATALSMSPSRQGFPKSRRKRLRLQRSRHHKMTFELTGVAADILVLPPSSGETQSSVDLRIRDFDIFDHVPTSTWKKFATYMHDAGERETGADMAHIELLNVKPDPDLAASEIVFKATVLPLRLHVDQDALDFITRFFEFKDENNAPAPSRSEVPFIQRAEVNSIPIKLDFKPKRVDYSGLRSGRTSEFMNFIVLDSADMVLRHVIIYGISGFDKLGKTLNDIWTPDVKRNQLPGVLAGLAPVRSLVNVGSGVRDLVVIPMREYRKDGRVMRSIQKGAMAFAKTTTTELTKLGAKLAVGTQTVLQNAEGVLVPKAESSEAQLSESPPEEKPIISPYADPPVGVVQGLRGGYRHLERDLLLARDAIVAMPGEVMDSGSAGGAAKAVLKGAPTVILRPALGVSKAVGQALMGATSALDKKERRRLDDKYKRW